MSKIDREGTFRGLVLEHGMSTTRKNGFPQWVARLSAVQMFVSEDDRESWIKEGYEISEDGWIDCSNWGWELTGYFVLFNHEKALLNYDQVIEATGWDGHDFQDLSTMDLTEHTVQFRVEMNEYEGTESLQISWIDVVGAPVDRELQIITEDDAKALNKKFKGLMRGKVKVAPVTAEKTSTKPKPASKGKAPAKTSAPPAKTTALPTPKTAETVAGMSKEDAWDSLLKNSGLDDDALADAWIKACEEVAPEKDEDDFTDQDWAAVSATVLTAVTA